MVMVLPNTARVLRIMFQTTVYVQRRDMIDYGCERITILKQVLLTQYSVTEIETALFGLFACYD